MSGRPRVAVLTCAALPSFIDGQIADLEPYFADDRALISALEARGVSAEHIVWSDPIEWRRFDIAVLRSTWDYIDHREEFLAVTRAIDESSCLLVNPSDAVLWNSDKGYLLDLQDWGVPVVPTERVLIDDLDGKQQWIEGFRDSDTVVVKPRVGVGGAGVRRIPVDGLAAALREIGKTEPLAGLLLQPLIDSVMTEGEFSFVFLGGSVSHVLVKRPAAGDFRAHGNYGGTVGLTEPPAGDIEQAEAIFARLGFDLPYARLDLVRVDGRLAAMEIELIEPMLYLDLAAGASDRLADAILERYARR